MHYNNFIQNRRQFLKNLSLGTIAFTMGGIFARDFFSSATESLAKDLTLTPRQTEGPFYPDTKLPDTDNDLVLTHESFSPAAGEVTHLTGRILDLTEKPVHNAVVEIWHVDNNGIYLHSQCPKQNERDVNFQGFGRSVTNSSGEYYFRTIKPVPYNIGVKRTPHIHFIIRKNGKRLLTTQMYIKGHPMNEQDFIFQHIQGKAARGAVLVDFKPIKGSPAGELEAHFDIVIGTTREDPSQDTFRNLDGIPVEKP